MLKIFTIWPSTEKVPNPEPACWALFQAFVYIPSINPPAALGGRGSKPREVKKQTLWHTGCVELGLNPGPLTLFEALLFVCGL